MALILVLLATPAGVDGQSLYRDDGPGPALFADFRARAVNDIITILIVEAASSSVSATTKTTKDQNLTAKVSKFFDPVTKKLLKPFTDTDVNTDLKDTLAADLQAQFALDGKGTIDRVGRVSGQISARVVKVLDNGNLLIEGRRAVVVNGETQVITISGVVRPVDVTAANTVRSSQIADAEIQLEGRGLIADAQRPGILFKLLEWLRIF